MHPATSADWKLVDGTLRGFALAKAQLDSEIGRWLIAAQRTKPWKKCGMRSLHEYFERIFGWTPHTIAERLRTATELVMLPELDAELASGRMNFSVVRELTRVAKTDTEREWIDFAAGKTVREVEEKVARHVKGDRPKDRGDVSRVKKRMFFALSADQYAVVASAFALMRKHDATLTDEECLRMMAASAVEAMKADSDDSATAPPFRLQVEIGLDGTSFLKGIGEERHEISPALAECAQCDAEVWIRRPDGTIDRVRVAIPQPMRRLLFEQAKGRCEVCKIRLKPQLHHLWLVSEGGKHDVEQMIALCPGHHDRVHEGSLWIRGTRKTGFTFTMADGSPYGSGAPTPMAAMHVEVFQGLRKMGFKELEIRPVLESLRERDLPIEELLRESLRMLHQQRNRPTRDETPAPAPLTISVESDAREGLRGLGFTDGEVTPVLALLAGRDLPLPELLRQSLQMLNRRRDGADFRPTRDATVSESRPTRDATASESRPTRDATVSEFRPTRDESPARPLWDDGDGRSAATPADLRPLWDEAIAAPAEQQTGHRDATAASLSSARPRVRKYRLNPPETDGVAETAAGYRVKWKGVASRSSRRPVRATARPRPQFSRRQRRWSESGADARREYAATS